MAENLAYGSQDAKDAVLSLFIDDGIKSRAHRNYILSPKLKYMAPCHGAHSKYDDMDTILYRGEYKEINED